MSFFEIINIFKEIIHMQTKNFALIAGLIMLIMGLASFAPILNTTEGLPPIKVNTSYALFLDVFPLNIFNKLALILFGIWGILTYFKREKSFEYSVTYAKAIFWVMGGLAVLGIIPQTNTLFGYWPLYGFEIFAHGIFAFAGYYYGYIITREEHFHHPHHMHKV